MQRIVILAICVWAAFVLGCGHGQTDIPAGRLGYPLGTYLTIEGSEHPGPFKAVKHMLVVDKVNGKRLARPVGVELSNIEGQELLPHERWILRGYETGRMEGIPDEVVKAENIQPFQTRGWGFTREFVITSVVEPNSIKARPLP